MTHRGRKIVQRSRRGGKTEEVRKEVKAAIERGEQVYLTDAPKTGDDGGDGESSREEK